VFQGSALGPASYVITAADLRTRHHESRLPKYADDTYLIVPAVVSHTVEEELNHIAEWSRANNLRLNQSKSQEIIFVTPGARRTLTGLPDLIQSPSRFLEVGVIINDQLTTSDHVTELIATCARTLYAIRTLKAHGLIVHALHTVFKATVQARLRYCAPAWSGYCTAADRDRLESFLRRCKGLGYGDVDTQSVVEQFQLADETLFERVLNDDWHVLHSLLPPRTEYSYNLRRRRHDYELIEKTRTLNNIMRMLYKNSY